MKSNKRPGNGIAFSLIAAAVSGISVYVAKFGTQMVPDPFVYTTARNLTVGILLVIGLAISGKRLQIHTLSRPTVLRLGLIAVIGGSVPFLLFFWGLTLTSAATGSLIQKTQFIWVALLVTPFLGERLNRLHLVAVAVLIGSLAVQGPAVLATPGLGVGLVFAATALWAAETIVVRRILSDVPVLLVATARMAGGAAIMVAALAATGRVTTLFQLNSLQLAWVIGPSLILLAYVLIWYRALQASPALVVTGLLALGAPVTAVLAGGAAIYSTFALPPRFSPDLATVLLVLGCAILLVATVQRPGNDAARPIAPRS